MARKKIYCVANDSGETTFVVAENFLTALELWRVENYDPKLVDEDDNLWPTSLALVTDGIILGLD